MSTAIVCEPASVLSPASHPEKSSDPDTYSSSSSSSALQPNLDEESRHSKVPMKGFVWGGDLVRRTLPLSPLPRWLDPLWVDADDPTRLPLCWYGVPFVPKLVYAYAERVGLARYYTMQVGRAKAGDLDTFQTWANLEEWFEKESGIKLDLNLVWGEGKKPKNILTFWSNHEIGRITREMWGQACDLLDDMDYGEEYAMLWYLDHNLDY